MVLLERSRVCSKTINDSSIDLEKFPASKVRQLAKKMEASKATTCHIKQVASGPLAAQVTLMRHQRTDLPPNKNKKKSKSFKSRPQSHKGIQVNTINVKCHPTKINLIHNKLTKEKIDVSSLEIQNI